MTPERWARIAEAFGQALDLPAGKRAAFLASMDDAELRREVEGLLEAEAKPSFRAPLGRTLSAAAELAPGETLAQYRVEVKIGAGGMGCVYRAYDSRLRRRVALKVLPPEDVADPHRRRRLMREARAASALNHPNIVTIYEIGSDRERDFIGMEYVSGKTLAELIGRRGLPLADTLKYATQIASAVAAAHGAGIVHRDLKPANIMVTGSPPGTGEVKVLDFGLARGAEPPPGAAAGSTEMSSETGAIAGTVSYMSPEQAEGKKLDARSDIFSFGAVLYEMLTGKRAFERDSTAATLAAILKEEPEPPRQLVRGVPRNLEKILNRCLRKDPGRRFQHMSELKAELEELREAQPLGRKRSRRLLWAAGVALVATAAAIGAWVARSRTTKPEAVFQAVPLTSYPGSERYPSFSPDGSQVAFQWCPEEPGRTCQIYVKQIGVEPPVRLTESPLPSDSPAWSPDGRTIAFARQMSRNREALILVPQRGGRERVLAEFDEEGSKRLVLDGPYLAWTPDSKWLVSSVFDPGATYRARWALFLFSAESGERRRLTNPRAAGREGDTAPAFSPDGRTLSFNRGDLSRSDLYTLRLGEGYRPIGEPEKVTSDLTWSRGAAWTPDGSEILFSSGTLARYGLWRVAAAARAKPRRLAFAGDSALQPAVSRQGNRLVYSVTRSDSNIWRVDLDGAGPKPGIPVKFIASTRDEGMPAYSPDGRRIAFVSHRSGASEVWVSDGDGSNPSQLTAFGGASITGPKWSPGGESIAFRVELGGKGDIYVISASGGAPRRMTIVPEGVKWPEWSRDGKWLFFTSMRTPWGAIWKMPASGGEAVQIGPSGVDLPHASPDGEWLYFSRRYPPPFSIWRIPVNGGRGAKVLDPVVSVWTVGKEGIYFITEPDNQGRRDICLRDFATGKIRTMGTTDRQLWLGMAVSPDGRTLLYSQFDDVGSDLMLVENFR